MATMAAPLIAAVVAFGAYKGFDYLNSGWTRAQDQAEVSVQAYEDAQSKLESLQGKQGENFEQAKGIALKYNIEVEGADTVDDIINRVEASDTTLNFVDEAELSRLSESSAELENQIKIQEKIAESKKKTALVDTEQASKAEKSYWEHIRGQHGEGVFGSIASVWDYITSQKAVYDENGWYTGKNEKDLWEEGGTTNIDLARKSLESLNSLKEESSRVDEKLAKKSGNLTDQEIKQREDLNSKISQATAETAGYLDIIQDQADTMLKYGADSDYAKKYIEDVNDIAKGFRQIDMTPAEKALDNLENFFDGKGKGAIKDYLRDSVKEGKNLKQALGEVGLTMDDLGISNYKQLRDYFKDASEEIDGATNKLDSFRVSVEDVEEASKSADQDAGWSTIQSAVKKGKELLEEGKTGTDDFQSIAQFLSPKNLKKQAKEAKEAGGYAADVYQEAFEQGLAKAERWFGEDETQSMMNAVDDFADAGLFNVNKSDDKGLWDIESQFNSTAEAADKLGVSVGAVETVLSALEAYGYEFDGVEKSGDMLNEFSDSLAGLKSVYDDMESGKGKDRVKDIIEGFDQEYSSFEEDLSGLTEEQVVHIKFEYDLAEIQNQMDQLQRQREGEGSNGNGSVGTRETNAQLIAQQGSYIQKSMEMQGLTSEGVEIPVTLKDQLGAVDQFKQNLANATSEGARQQAQEQLIQAQQAVIDTLNQQDTTALQNEVKDAVSKGAEEGHVEGAQKSSEEVSNIQKESSKNAQEQLAEESGIQPMSTASLKNAALDPDMLAQFQSDMQELSGSSELEIEAKVKANELDTDGLSGEEATIEGGKIQASEIEAPEGDAIELDANVNTATVEDSIGSLSGQEIEATLNADASQAEGEISSLSNQQIDVSMNVDTSQAEGAAESLQGQQVDVDMNVDTSGADGALSSLEGQSVTATVNADTSAASGAISGLSGQAINVSVNVDAPEAPQYEDQSPQVAYGINAPAAPVYPDQNPAVNYHINAPSPPSYPNISRTVTYHIVTVGSPPAVDGTAHARGTAYARGDWGTKSSGIALGGELGRELVVRDGKFFTIGDTGAEMFAYKKDDIIFNAEQTKQIFEKGKITHGNRRGRALAEGTAFRLGSGGSSSSGGSSNSGGGSGGSGGSGGGSSGGGGGGNSSSSSSKAKDSKADYIDWIEIKLKRVEEEIKTLDKASKDTFAKWSTRNDNLVRQIQKTTEEIDLQGQAYQRYIGQANSVPLAQDLRDKVIAGTIDINEYDDETRKNIEQYKKWYENAVKCQEAIRDLKLELKDLYSSQFKNIITTWENALQNLEQTADKVKSLITRREDFASDYVQMSLSRDASNANIKSYLTLINNLSDQRSKRQSELAKLTDKLASGTTKGIVAKGSEEYYKLLKDIQEVEDEINDLNEDIIKVSNSISKEYVKVFNSIYDEYKNKLSLSEHLSKEYNNYLDIAEAKGLKTSSVYYSKLKSIAESNAKNASQLAKDLQKQLTKAVGTGEIRRGSEAWYEMTERINDAVEAEQEAIKKAQEYANKVREIKWDKFDYLQNSISDIREEAEFLIDLFEDSVIFEDNGAINDNGKAILGLHAMNYDVAMNQADRYANEIIRLNSEIANDSSNSDLLERRKELLKAQRESIKAAEDEKHSIKSLISDGFKKELDYLDDIIEKYKDALDNQKDLYDYQKNIQKQTSEISSLQKQLSAYANDVTEETRAKIQKISVELKEKQDKLEETEYDRMVSDSKKMLDNFYDDYQEALNKRLDNIDTLIENVIDSSNENASSISETIKEKADSVGLTLSSELKDIWDGSLDTVLNVYGDRHLSALTTINQTILSVRDAVYGLWQQADAVAKSDSSAIGAESSNKKKQEADAAKKAKSTKAKASNASKATTSIGDIMKTSEKKYQTELAKQNSQKQFAKYGDWAYVYDYNFYRSHNKDLQQAFGNDEEKYFEHFKQYGMKEGRQGNALFNVHYYKNQYKDLQKAFGNNLAEYYKHFMSYGINEGRSPNKNFNFSKYKSNNKDVAKAFGKNTKEYYKHWLQYGQHENRKSYATGAKRVGTTGYAWTQEGANEVYLRASDHAVLTRVGADDRIYNAMASENLWQAANNPANFIANNLSGLNTSSIGGIHNGAKVEQNFDNISFVMPNVRNYNELVAQMQQDKNFEKLIQAMTLGQLNGKSSDMKYRLRFK